MEITREVAVEAEEMGAAVATIVNTLDAHRIQSKAVMAAGQSAGNYTVLFELS